jgi:hypothetical protein
MSRRTEKMAEAAAAEANRAAMEPVAEPIAESVEKPSTDASEAGRVLRAQRDKPEPPKPRHEENPRNKIYKEIVESRLEKAEEPDTDKPLEVKDTPEVPAPVATPPASPPTEPPPSVEPVGVASTVKVKVDGVESEVPQSEIDEYGGVKAYQISKAAENRLNKANETVAQSNRQQAQLMQLMQAAFQRQQEPVKTPVQQIQERIDAVRYGTPEESAKAMQEILELSNPRIDQAALEHRTMARMKQTLAVDNFRTEFADVVANPILMTAARSIEQERLQKMQAEGQTPDWPVFYRQLGNELRAVIGPKQSQPTPTPQPETGTPSQSKEERKASNIVSLPQASARAASKEKEELTPEQSRAKAIRDMRRARGQPTE